MQWTHTGEITEGEVESQEICESKGESLVILDVPFLRWESCMQICPKFFDSEAPPIGNQEEYETTLKWIRKIIFGAKENTRTTFTIWLPISDQREELTTTRVNHLSWNFPNWTHLRTMDFFLQQILEELLIGIVWFLLANL